MLQLRQAGQQTAPPRVPEMEEATKKQTRVVGPKVSKLKTYEFRFKASHLRQKLKFQVLSSFKPFYFVQYSLVC